MGNRVYLVSYGDPLKTKEVAGESFLVAEDGCLYIYGADKTCVLAFAPYTWFYIENTTSKASKEPDK